MKTCAILATLAVAFCVGAAFVGPTHAAKEECCFSSIERGGGVIHTKRIVAEELFVPSGDGKSSLLIKSLENGVGMWVKSGDEYLSLITNSGNRGPGPYVGVISAKDPTRGCQLAIGIGRDGEAFLQISGKDGKLKMVSPDDLLKSLDK